MSPTAVLIMKGERVELFSIKNATPNGTIDRVLNMIPPYVDEDETKPLFEPADHRRSVPDPGLPHPGSVSYTHLDVYKRQSLMLHENIKAIRKSKGLSQEELAIKLNVVRQTISKCCLLYTSPSDGRITAPRRFKKMRRGFL